MVGRSRDTGRLGAVTRASVSVDFDLTKEAFDMLPGRESPSLVTLVFLLNVLQTDPTLDSVSFLLFSLLSVPKPKRLRREEALELNEPVLIDRARCEFIDPLIGVASPFELAGGVSKVRVSCANNESVLSAGLHSNSLSESSTSRSKSVMYSCGFPSRTSNSAKAAVSAPRSPSLPDASSKLYIRQ